MMTFWSFVGQWILAVLAAALAIYMPGRLLLRLLKMPMTVLERLAGSLVSGMALLVLFYWGISILDFQFLLWFYVLGCAGLEGWLTFQEERRKKRVPHYTNDPLPETLVKYWPLGLLVLGGMIAQAWFMVFTAWQGPEGMSLLAWHAQDAPWHIFNIYQFAHGFPPEMPGFAGQMLRNYHMFSDLLWGAIVFMVPIDPWHVYFRVAPFLYSGLLTLTVFVVARTWSGQNKIAYLAAALTIFSSNFGYLMPLFFGGEGKYFIWDSVFWVTSPMLNIFNPGVSASYALVMMGLWALLRWLRERRPAGLILLVLLWGVLPGFKVYPGLLVMAALLITGLLMLVFHRDWGGIIAGAVLSPLFLLVFLPPNLHAPGLVRLLPGFNLGTMLVAPDRMALMSSADFKMLFIQKPWLVGLIMAGLLLIFLVGNLGVRAIGLVSLLKTVRHPRRADPFMLFITLMVGGALAGAVLFVQVGMKWNTIQFFYYAVLISVLPAAEQFWRWGPRLKPGWRRVFLAGFILLGLPGIIQAWWVIDFKHELTPQTCEALAWLRKTAGKDEVILAPLPDKLVADQDYRQWQHERDRGIMTSMKAWRREARDLLSSSAIVPPKSRPAAPISEPVSVGKSSPTPSSQNERLAEAQLKLKTLVKEEIRAKQAVLEKRQALALARDTRALKSSQKNEADLKIEVLKKNIAEAAGSGKTAGALRDDGLGKTEELPVEDVLEEKAASEGLSREGKSGVQDQEGLHAAGKEDKFEDKELNEDSALSLTDHGVFNEPVEKKEEGLSPSNQGSSLAEVLTRELSKREALIQEEHEAKAEVLARTEELAQAGKQLQSKIRARKRALVKLQEIIAAMSEPKLPRPSPEAWEEGVKKPDPPRESKSSRWMDSPLVAALTFRNTYLEGTISGQIMGYRVQERARRMRYFYQQADILEAVKFLRDEDITYIILPAGTFWSFNPDGVPLRKVYENKDLAIYKFIPRGAW